MSRTDTQESELEGIANTSDLSSTETDAQTRSTIDEVVEQLKALINNDYKPGDRLPSIESFTFEGTVGGSRYTIADAIGILKEEGLVITIHRFGTFVPNGDNAVYRDYMEISGVLKKRIDSGEYKYALPRYKKLETEFKRPISTIKRAIKELERYFTLQKDVSRAYIGENGKRDFMEARFKELYPDEVPSRSRLYSEHEALYRQISRYQQRTGDKLLDRLVPAPEEYVQMGIRLQAIKQEKRMVNMPGS